MENSVNKAVLSNGVRILTQNVPHVRSVSMGIWVHAGARDERLLENGLSHFIEHMIFKGTRKRTAYSIAKELDAIGGQANAFTAMEFTCYHAKVMDIHLVTMVDILSDIFLHSEIHPTELEKERPVILQEIGMTEDSPEDWVHTLLLRSLWGDHPLGRSILGTRETISRFDSETIRSFLQKQYQPDRIVIAAAGNLDHSAFVDLVAPAFEAVFSGNRLPNRTPPDVTPETQICPRDTEQVHICLGTNAITTTDPRRYTLSLLNSILGGNMSSRLFQEIREKRGLAYAVYSFTSSHEDTGMLGIYSGVAPDQTEVVMDLLIREMRKMATSHVEASELFNAKQFTNGNILLSLENTDNVMFQMAQNEISFGHEISIQSVLDGIEAVTVEQIHDLVNVIFQEDRLAVSLLGPDDVVTAFSI